MASALAVMVYAGTRPVALSAEAMAVRESCAQDYALSRNYHCDCIAAQFMTQRKLDRRAEKDGLLNKVMRERGKACVNGPALREAALLSCRDLRAQTYRDVDCHCVARAAVKQAREAAHPLRQFTPMPAAAQKVCGI